MLILIGSDGNKLESPIAKRFGHADYFILYNTEAKSFEAFENIDEGHNHENLQQFLDKGVEVFIVGNIGPHAFEVINTPKSKVYLARKMSVQEAVDKFLKGELKQLTEPTAKRSIGHGKDEEHHGKHHHDGEHRGRGKHNHDE
ncbi:MAG TPA: NifB/NifX family molybdenum-iron cluster-binding protein [Ignavibacteriaceae bacterium]|jgi:predicted Fe-Mo cluster-binding NifX family protein|nr:NifB/NifX family molybdenum-iron cluster-binding protein [Ignavibacteriaceae bacterium]